MDSIFSTNLWILYFPQIYGFYVSHKFMYSVFSTNSWIPYFLKIYRFHIFHIFYNLPQDLLLLGSNISSAFVNHISPSYSQRREVTDNCVLHTIVKTASLSFFPTILIVKPLFLVDCELLLSAKNVL